LARPQGKYLVDTNLFIDGFRDPTANQALQQFHHSFAPFEYLSVVVAQELRSGVHSASDLRKLERHVLSPFVRSNRVITPSFRAWQRSGDVIAALARRDGFEVRDVSKAFGNDVLLALTCREAGMTLVTGNTRDFERIQRIVSFRFVEAWPVPRL